MNDDGLNMDLIHDMARERRAAYHKPFHAGMRMLKVNGSYDNGIFFIYNAVPFGRLVPQHGKHRLFRAVDSERGKSRPHNLERFVRLNRRQVYKTFRGPYQHCARQTLDAVDALRVGQSVVFHLWAWDTTITRIR